jgi:hypothetical protein
VKEPTVLPLNKRDQVALNELAAKWLAAEQTLTNQRQTLATAEQAAAQAKARLEGAVELIAQQQSRSSVGLAWEFANGTFSLQAPMKFLDVVTAVEKREKEKKRDN